MDMYIVKLSTGENITFRSEKEAKDIVIQARSNEDKVIMDLHDEAEGKYWHVFARNIVGYVVIKGKTLENIVKENRKSLYEEMEDASELNLYSETYVPKAS